MRSYRFELPPFVPVTELCSKHCACFVLREESAEGRSYSGILGTAMAEN